MTELLAWVKANVGAAATISAAIIALCGVIFSAFSAFLTGRRSVYISSVTAERSKWIDKLRSNLAELLQVCAAINNEALTTRNYDKEKNRADGLISLILLQLNPTDEDGIDRNLIMHIDKLFEEAQKKDGTFRDEEKKFVRHSQFMLKEEWEKVKSEARGWTATLWDKFLGNRSARKYAYNRFVSEELQHILPQKLPATKLRFSNEKIAATTVDILAAFASFAGYAGLFTMVNCNEFDLTSNWWAVFLATSSLLPIAIIPFIAAAKRWPDKIYARWCISIASTVFLIWLASFAAQYFPGAC